MFDRETITSIDSLRDLLAQVQSQTDTRWRGRRCSFYLHCLCVKFQFRRDANLWSRKGESAEGRGRAPFWMDPFLTAPICHSADHPIRDAIWPFPVVMRFGRSLTICRAACVLT